MLKWCISVSQQPEDRRSFYGHNALLLEHFQAVGKLASEGEADIAYVQFGMPLARGRLRTVYQAVTILSPFFEVPVRSREMTVARRAFQAADMVIAHSDLHRRSFELVAGDLGKVRIVRPAPLIPLRSRADPPPALAKIVGFAGRMDPFKRNGAAKRAAAVTGAQFSWARDLLFKDMAPWYDRIGVLAMPSLAESWGLVVSEALARGVPAVCTAAAGAAEEILETGAGLVVDSVSQDDFADAVRRVLSDRSFADRAWASRPREPIAWLHDLISTVEEGLEHGGSDV